MDSKNSKLLGGITIFALCAYWFWAVALVRHSVDDPPWIFLDFANLIFHEAGHVIFLLFGNFLHVLGGSLMQLLVPAAALGTFIKQKEPLSAGFALFWLGESANNLSYYIADARSQALPLLGGDSSGHDWTWLLTTMHVLSSDTAIGSFVRFLAFVSMVSGLGWMIAGMYRDYCAK